MANENMRLSADGYTALRQREGATLRYYNDVANNCTFGVGTLAHLGPCTDAEIQTPVTEEQVNLQLASRVATAERAVRARVQLRTLTQAEFDSLVSFTFNVGASGARTTLDAANRSDNPGVTRLMNAHVYVHPRDAQGRRLPAVRVTGLVNRRREEATAFAQRVQP